jgi:GH15 family glucan-1,4-alpha-glucosidase
MNKVGKDTNARKNFRLLRACSRFQKPTHIAGEELCRNGLSKPGGRFHSNSNITWFDSQWLLSVKNFLDSRPIKEGM